MPAQVPIGGRVIAPDGKPVPGASIYIGQSQFGWTLDPVARTDADGRFRFVLDTEKERLRQAEFIPRRDWKLEKVELTAHAPGFGAAWSGTFRAGVDDVELRLVPDDVPLLGRVLDTQGRPIAGVTVRVAGVGDPPAGDLDALLKTGIISEDQSSGGFYTVAWSIKEGGRWTQRTVKTGPDGRFRIDGAGRDRLVTLEFDVPGIERGKLRAMTRPATPNAGPMPPPANPYYQPARYYPLHGATFDHVASPSRPVEGVVRLKGTGQLLEGILVQGGVSATGAYATAITGKDGRFRLDGLPKAASYWVQADPQLGGKPYLQTRKDVTDTDGLAPIEVTLELPKGVVVRVRLVDKTTGKVVAVQAVHHFKLPSNLNEGQATDVGPFDGFQMIVPPGPAIFYAEVAGEDLPYTRARLAPADRGKGVGDLGDGEPISIILSDCHTYRIVDVPAGVDTFALDLELTRGASRKGRLIDPDGQPLAGVIAYGLAANWQVKTLGDLTFEAVGLETGRPRTASFIYIARRLAGAVLIEPGDGPVEVRLAPCGSAVGRLVDGDGHPLAGAMVQLQPQDHRGELFPLNVGLWPEGEVFTADQDGRFRVEGINPALGVRVTIHPRSRPDVFLVPEKSKQDILGHLKAKPGETIDLGDVHLTR